MVAVRWGIGLPNNATASGYGIRLLGKDRNEHFQQEWLAITIELEDDGTTAFSRLTPKLLDKKPRSVRV